MNLNFIHWNINQAHCNQFPVFLFASNEFVPVAYVQLPKGPEGSNDFFLHSSWYWCLKLPFVL